MRRNHLSLVLIFVVLFLFLQMGVYATSYTLGVEEGDWVKYGDVACTWYGNPEERPQNVKDLQNVEWIEVNVTKISGLNVSLLMTKHFQNGSESEYTLMGDIETGNGSLQGQVIAGGLVEGDRIYDSDDAPVIGATKLKKYAGAFREINNANFTLGKVGGNQYQFYWDTETGILCEQRVLFFHPTVEGEIPYLFLMTMTDTNLWEPETNGSDGSGLLAVVLIISAAILIVILLKAAS